MLRFMLARPLNRAIYQPIYRHQSTHSSGRGGLGIAFGITVGSVAAFSASIYYANYNPLFRTFLLENIPHSDRILDPSKKFIDHISSAVGIAQKKIPENDFSLLKNKLPLNSENRSAQDILVTLEEDEKLSETQVQEAVKKLEDTMSMLNIASVSAVSICSQAAQSWRNLAEKLQDSDGKLNNQKHNQEGENVINVLMDQLKTSHQLESQATQATSELSVKILSLRSALDELTSKKVPLPENFVQQTLESLSLYERQLKEAEMFLENAHSSLGPLDKLDKQIVQLATEELGEEFWHEFVKDNPKEKRDHLMMFVALHILRYKEEVEKLMALQEKRRIELLAAQGKEGREQRLKILLEDKEKDLERSLTGEYQAKLAEVRERLHHQSQMKLQRQAVTMREKTSKAIAERKSTFSRELSEQWEKVVAQTNTKKEQLIEELRKAEPHLNSRVAEITKNEDFLEWANLCHAFVEVLKTEPFPQLDWTHQVQPINNHIEELKATFKGTDFEFIDAVVATIPSKAMTRGVYTERALKERFVKMEWMARKTSMLKERESNSLFMYVLSYLRSSLLIHPVKMISLSEIANEPVDHSTLHNEALLDRARFFIELGELEQALKYVNMLEGVSQFVGSGWSEEVQIHLEVLRAAQVLSAFATLLLHHHLPTET